MKILAFAGSNSSKSINHQIFLYIGKQINEVRSEVLRITDFDIP